MMREVRIFMAPDVAAFLIGRKDIPEMVRDRRMETMKRGRETLCALQLTEQAMKRLAAKTMLLAD